MVKVIQEEKYGKYSCNGCSDNTAFVTIQLVGHPFTDVIRLCPDCAEKLELYLRLALNKGLHK